MYILMVRIKVKQDRIDDFIKTSIGDAEGSVRNEPGCRRFDIIQDADDPTLFGFTEVYNDEVAFEDHKTYSHYKEWQGQVDDMFDGDVEVSFCRPVYPRGDASWDAMRAESAIDHAYFAGSSLHVIHAPQYVQKERVGMFIEAVTLDGIGSTHEEQGCLRFDVYQNVDDPTELYLYEVYVNPAAFDYHRETPHIAKWQSTVKDWYDEPRRAASAGRRVGRNIWPPDNWGWSSAKPTW